MPIKVEIKVNDDIVSVVQIARISGGLGTQADKTHVYAVAATTDPVWVIDWDDYPTFEHRYGDGVNVCVAKGLQRLEETETETNPSS